MRVLLAVLFVCLSLTGSIFAAEKLFLDIPKGHWAEPSVYRLVDLGVTGGYEDGTFRGQKSVTRYELALYLSNFESATVAKLQKKVESQQQDIDQLKKEIQALKASAKAQKPN